MTERRCDNCAYWEPPEDDHPPILVGVCHHAEAILGDDEPHGTRRGDWWCNHYWPADRPLPEPWAGLGECVEVEP